MLRVAVWGTGNMGATAIRSAAAFPGLQLSGVITSSPDKDGKDAAVFARLDADTGVSATTDVDAALTGCDGVAYTASGAGPNPRLLVLRRVVPPPTGTPS